jgi:hypothetical protein
VFPIGILGSNTVEGIVFICVVLCYPAEVRGYRMDCVRFGVVRMLHRQQGRGVAVGAG